jgi:hypothetical protein
MKYYTDTYSGIDNIFDDILNKDNKTNIENSDFAYVQKYHKLNLKQIDNIKYFNNFLDPHNQLCQTGNYCLGNKSEFYNYYLKYYKKKPKYIPKTYTFYSNNLQNIKTLFNGDIWIVKPTNAFARKGINVINNYKDLISWIKEYPNFKEWVLQEYIQTPLLYNNKKFHIRFYCLAVKDKTSFKSYIYKDGFFYLASMPYSKNDLNLSRHLTGAKYCYVHQVYPDLENYVTKNQFNNILSQSKQIIIDTMSICQEILKCPNKSKISKNGKCFHLFAFDLLPDINGNLHLLEVNNGTVGMETINYRPDLCLNKSSKKLHNISIIRSLHNDLIDIVTNKNKKTKFSEINLIKFNVIEEFTNNKLVEKNSNLNYKYILIYLLFLSLLFLIIKKKL